MAAGSRVGRARRRGINFGPHEVRPARLHDPADGRAGWRRRAGGGRVGGAGRRAATPRRRPAGRRHRHVGHGRGRPRASTATRTWRRGTASDEAETDGGPLERYVAAVHPDDRPEVERRIAAALASDDSYSAEYRLTTGGGERWMVARGNVERDAAGRAAADDGGGGRRHRPQASRGRRPTRPRTGGDRRQRCQRRRLWYCPLPFDVLHWDEKVKEHFHLPPDADVTIDTFYDRIHPDDRERTRAAIDRSMVDRTSYDIDYRTVSPDGRRVKWDPRQRADVLRQGRQPDAVRRRDGGRDRPRTGRARPAGERGAVPPARRRDAADRLHVPAGRLRGLLQRAVVRLHRPAARRGGGRELGGSDPPRRPAAHGRRVVDGDGGGGLLRDRVPLPPRVRRGVPLAPGPRSAGARRLGADRPLVRHGHRHPRPEDDRSRAARERVSTGRRDADGVGLRRRHGPRRPRDRGGTRRRRRRSGGRGRRCWDRTWRR